MNSAKPAMNMNEFAKDTWFHILFRMLSCPYRPDIDLINIVFYLFKWDRPLHTAFHCPFSFVDLKCPTVRSKTIKLETSYTWGQIFFFLFCKSYVFSTYKLVGQVFLINIWIAFYVENIRLTTANLRINKVRIN